MCNNEEPQLVVKHHHPANKKIDVQNKFKSIKKKRKQSEGKKERRNFQNQRIKNGSLEVFDVFQYFKMFI